VRAGASLQGAMFWQNFAMMMSLVGLLQRWALKLTRSRGAALVATALVILSGGFGWWTFLGEAESGARSVFGLLGGLEHDYTIMGHLGYQWGNAVTALFVTQRSILLGVALALVVWTLWWEASEKAKGKRQKAKDESDEEAARSVVENRSVMAESRGVGKKKVKSKVKGGSKTARGRSRQGANADAPASTGDTFAFCL